MHVFFRKILTVSLIRRLVEVATRSRQQSVECRIVSDEMDEAFSAKPLPESNSGVIDKERAGDGIAL